MGTVVDEAVALHEAGFQVVVLEPNSKTPAGGSWTTTDYASAEDIRRAFGPDNNLGLRMTKGLVDVDVDSERIAVLAAQWLPHTEGTTGRPNSQRMHRFYLTKQRPMALRRSFPISGRTIIELRTGDNQQTMMPPSIHPSGEE